MKLLLAVTFSTASSTISKLSLEMEVTPIRNWAFFFPLQSSRKDSLVPKEIPLPLILRRQLWCWLIVAYVLEFESSYWAPFWAPGKIMTWKGRFEALFCSGISCFALYVWFLVLQGPLMCLRSLQRWGWSGWEWERGRAAQTAVCVLDFACWWKAGSIMFLFLFGGGNCASMNDIKLNFLTLKMLGGRERGFLPVLIDKIISPWKKYSL